MSTILDLLNHPLPKDDCMKTLIRDTIMELIGTTLFIFTGTLSIVSLSSSSSSFGGNIDVLAIAMSFGITYMVLLYTLDHFGGCHMNPAITFMMFLKRKISFMKLIGYWLVQFLGSMVGASLTWGCTSELKNGINIDRPPFLLGSTILNETLSDGNGFLIEFMASFFFLLVIVQSILDNRCSIIKTPFSAMAIGFTMIVLHIGLYPFTGCSLNPARTFGPSMVSCMTDQDTCDMVVEDSYWIYWIAPFAASICVAELHTVMGWNMKDEHDDDSDNDETFQDHKMMETGGGDEEA